jgi:hypothetical protein
VLKREGLNEFLYARAKLAMVAPGIEASHIWGDCQEKGVDLVEARLDLFPDGRGNGRLDCTKAVPFIRPRSVFSCPAAKCFSLKKRYTGALGLDVIETNRCKENIL